MFLETALVLSGIEQMKNLKGSFNSSGWLFHYLLSLPKIISPWEKEILTRSYFSENSWPN